MIAKTGAGRKSTKPVNSAKIQVADWRGINSDTVQKSKLCALQYPSSLFYFTVVTGSRRNNNGRPPSTDVAQKRQRSAIITCDLYGRITHVFNLTGCRPGKY